MSQRATTPRILMLSVCAFLITASSILACDTENTFARTNQIGAPLSPIVGRKIRVLLNRKHQKYTINSDGVKDFLSDVLDKNEPNSHAANVFYWLAIYPDTREMLREAFVNVATSISQELQKEGLTPDNSFSLIQKLLNGRGLMTVGLHYTLDEIDHKPPQGSLGEYLIKINPFWRDIFTTYNTNMKKLFSLVEKTGHNRWNFLDTLFKFWPYHLPTPEMRYANDVLPWQTKFRHQWKKYVGNYPGLVLGSIAGLSVLTGLGILYEQYRYTQKQAAQAS